MRKFQDKNDYLEYLHKKFKFEQAKLAIMDSLDKTSFDPIKMKLYFYVKLNAEIRLLNYITENLSNDFFIHINEYELDLDYVDLLNIISTIKDIAKHKKVKMSTDMQEYRREINQIKKNANLIQSLSKNDLEIELPRHPYESYFILIEYFKTRDALSKDTIKDISLFFMDRLPKSGNASNERLADLNDLKGGKVIEEMMMGTDMDIIFEIISSNDFLPQNEINKLKNYSPNKKGV